MKNTRIPLRSHTFWKTTIFQLFYKHKQMLILHAFYKHLAAKLQYFTCFQDIRDDAGPRRYIVRFLSLVIFSYLPRRFRYL